MRSLSIFLMSTALLAGACGSETTAQAPSDPIALQPDETGQAPVSVPAEPDASVPDNVDGVDLDEVGPADDVSFCDAFATTPARWIDDAPFTIQFWLDGFTAAQSTAPTDAVGPIDRLIEYGEHNRAWHFGQQDERRMWTSALAADARAIADAAVATCPDLPLVAAPLGQSATPRNWADDTPEQIAVFCQSASDDVAEGISWYLTEFATLPGHQQQIETAANEAFYLAIEETGEYPDNAFIYYASDYYGVGASGKPMAVPGGACDL